MPRTDLKYHYDEACNDVPVLCCYCDRDILRGKLSEHKTQCAEQKVYCKYCYDVLKRKNISNHEQIYCDMYPVKCETYPACKVDVPRYEQMDHADTCL
mmetsp:Transcript_18566/g.25666  ORF Transcript_18566/g.25666 Transcript_18566/m.25666 type:complete len:98 (+) Transcript_18566:515-808(+)